MALLEIKNLTFKYELSKTPSLKNINLNFEEGDFVVVSGNTGSGKSTLLKMIKKEVRPKGYFSGEIIFSGKNINQLSDKESVTNIGFVMQNPKDQIVTNKVSNELLFGLENIGLNHEQMLIRVSEIVSYFGIDNWYESDTHKLSGGQKHILTLASILIMQPKIILLDEPTSQLDPISASNFLQTLKKLNQDFGITIVIVEHRLDEVFLLADKVVILDEGKLVAHDHPSQIAKEAEIENIDYSLPLTFQVMKKLNINNYPLTIKDTRKLIQKYKNEINFFEVLKEDIDSTPIIKTKSLFFGYESNIDVIRDLNLEIFENEIFTIVGSNGSGKSTLLKLLANVLNPYHGKVYLKNRNIKKYRDDLYINNIAYLPQNPDDLFFEMTVREELNLNNTFISELVGIFELESLLDKHPFDLSGGQKQIIGILKILNQNPKVILLDEPTKGLDGQLKEKLKKLIWKLQLNNYTIIIVSHDLEFASLVSSRIGLLFAGNIKTIANSNKFFSQNYYYTTIINKITRGHYNNVVTVEDLYKILELNGEL